MSQKRNPTMTSLEAAALYLSKGATTDVELATNMDRGQLMDMDALERSALQRALGFDVEVDYNQKDKAVIKDMELGYVVTTPWSDADDELNSKRLAKAVIKLKKLHDTPEADTNG